MRDYFVLFLTAALMGVLLGQTLAVADEATGPTSGESVGMAGMDEAVNERLAEEAGVPPRDPFINTEEMGDLWNALLLMAGGVCGFIVGRWWHLLWGKAERQGEMPRQEADATVADRWNDQHA